MPNVHKNRDYDKPQLAINIIFKLSLKMRGFEDQF